MDLETTKIIDEEDTKPFGTMDGIICMSFAYGYYDRIYDNEYSITDDNRNTMDWLGL